MEGCQPSLSPAAQREVAAPGVEQVFEALVQTNREVLPAPVVPWSVSDNQDSEGWTYKVSPLP